MTVHSGIFGPVHTGILSGIQFYGALRLQRRLESAPPLRLRGPNRCVPPSCGTTAPSNSGAPLPASSSALPLTSSRFRPFRARPPATVCGFPFFANYATYASSPATSSGAGSPPWRQQSPSASSRVSPSTLRCLLHLPGQSGGFQAALTGLLGDPKDKGFMTIVPEAIDALQLLNSRRVLKHTIRECIRRWKTAAEPVAGCLLGKCFRGFSFCPGWLCFPRLLPLFCSRAPPLSSCWCHVGQILLFPFPLLLEPASLTQTLVGRGQSRSCRGGTFGCTMLSSSEYHREATQKGSFNH